MDLLIEFANGRFIQAGGNSVVKCFYRYSTKTSVSVFSLLEYREQNVASLEKVTQASSLKKVASRMLAVLRGIEIY